MRLVPRHARRFFQLLRGARENPLVRAGAPWRQGLVPALFFWLQAAIAVAYVALMLFTGLVVAVGGGDYRPQIGGQSFHFEEETFFLLLCLPVTVVAFPLNLLVYTGRWLRPGRLQDLYLTTMPHEEVAFGMFLWPVACGAMLPLANWLGALPYLAAMWADYFRSQNRIFFGPDFEVVLPAALIIAGLLLLAESASVTLRLWLYRLGARWVVLITGTVVTWLHLLGVVTAAGMLLALTEDLAPSGWEVTQFCAFALVLAAVVTRHHVATTMRWGPILLFRPIRMDVFAEESFIGNMGIRFCARELRAGLGSALRRDVRVEWWAGAFYLSIAVPLLALEASRVGETRLPFAFNVTASLVLLSATSAFVVLRRVAPGGTMRCLSGVPFGALMRPLHALHAAHLAVGLLACPILERTLDPGDIVGPALLILLIHGVLAFANIIVFTWALSLRGAWARSMALTWPIIAALAWLLGMALRDASRRARPQDYLDVADPVFYAGCALGLVLLYFSLPIFQRFYEARVKDAKLGFWRETQAGWGAASQPQQASAADHAIEHDRPS